ncbi:M23 family metallopeptidase [Rhodovulum sulfidophilum]|uniref:M23 family metallopeptidase n=1 Tax=Rhodovulum sulfidophilum TaxID=35806 RepID=UPI001926646F|nr:M23 family metallopeptidase [Rhodovulum sulfidophilum]MBL3587600.1 M23 family metallopeptidase [Rhodovulum sulfidophilum]
MTVTVSIPKSNRSIRYDETKFTAFRSTVRTKGCITLFDRADPGRTISVMSNARSDMLAEGDVTITGDACPDIAAGVGCTSGAATNVVAPPLDVQGCLSPTSVVLDIFVGPVQQDLHLDLLELRGPGGESLMLLQQRALLAYARVFHDGQFCWNAATVPQGGFLMIHLPRITLPKHAYHELAIRLSGCDATSAVVDQTHPAHHLPGPKRLARPVPYHWRTANTPDLLSIHRFAVGIRNRRCSVAQRGAMDFNLVAGRPEDSTDPAAYPAFGQIVTAPCAGKVIIAEDDHPDMPVGARDEKAPRGNQICIRRSDGLVVVLAHLQNGSLMVDHGAQLKTGQPLARVGNSGRSSEPHLHMHLASSADNMADGHIFHFRGHP